MDPAWRQWLTQVHGLAEISSDLVCLFLVHNEAHLLPDLLAHYRAMADVQFLVIDDRSTDGTRALLEAEPDVLIFAPVEGSTYAKDKRAWRGSLLDGFAPGKWCLVIDADERLVWRGYPGRTLAHLIAEMEAQGAEALIATMLDMYADRPIADHLATDAPLAKTFDRFDDPAKDPLAYRMALTPKRFRQNFPMPNAVLMGGMRDRLFVAPAPGPITRWLTTGALRQPRHIPQSALPLATLKTRLTRPRGEKPPLNLTKVPLVKWRPGLRYNGGAHHLSAELPPAREYGVLLHYSITRGAEGISYLANRGQHARGGDYYRAMLDSGSLGTLNPVYGGTTRLTDFAQLDPFFGDASA